MNLLLSRNPSHPGDGDVPYYGTGLSCREWLWLHESDEEAEERRFRAITRDADFLAAFWRSHLRAIVWSLTIPSVPSK